MNAWLSIALILMGEKSFESRAVTACGVVSNAGNAPGIIPKTTKGKKERPRRATESLTALSVLPLKILPHSPNGRGSLTYIPLKQRSRHTALAVHSISHLKVNQTIRWLLSELAVIIRCY
jgi:hypothetical protein